MTILDSRAIQEILPHRFPFLFVDKIIELVPRQKIVGIKQVTINEYFFQGHFPDAPVMPGVLQIEALAQERLRRLVIGEGRAGGGDDRALGRDHLGRDDLDARLPAARARDPRNPPRDRAR